jgi:hypothetical protein
MDLTSFLKGEVFRAVVITLIPGVIVLIPMAFYVYDAFPGVRNMLVDRDAVAAVLLIVGAISAGFIVEDLGSRLEIAIWRFCLSKLSTAEKQAAEEEWFRYLRQTLERPSIGLGYIADIALRMKFENSFAIASLWSFVAIVLLSWTGHIKAPIWVPCIFLAILFVYLIVESISATKLLIQLRKRVVEIPPGVTP